MIVLLIWRMIWEFLLCCAVNTPMKLFVEKYVPYCNPINHRQMEKIVYMHQLCCFKNMKIMQSDKFLFGGFQTCMF